MVKVSVIIPVFNAQKYLKESLEGILNQTLDDLEVICVDDGSTDESLSILNEMSDKDSRVKYFHQENKGGGTARNVAIPYATGEYIYFMDADDILDSNALKECYDICEEKKLDFVIFQAMDYAEDTGEYFKSKEYIMEELADFVGDKVFNYRDLGNLIFKMSVTPWCKFYNREFVVKSGAKFAEGLIFHDNIFFYDSLFYAERIYFHRKILYTRRRHSASSTGAGDERYINIVKITDMIWNIFFKHDVFDEYIDDMALKKIGSVNYRYKNIKPEFKKRFFEEIKRNYQKIAEDKKFTEYFTQHMLDWEKNIFYSILEAETCEEYDLMCKNYDLEIENNHLKELLNKPFKELVSFKFNKN